MLINWLRLKGVNGIILEKEYNLIYICSHHYNMKIILKENQLF